MTKLLVFLYASVNSTLVLMRQAKSHGLDDSGLRTFHCSKILVKANRAGESAESARYIGAFRSHEPK